jgi:hypothetical protein
VHDQDLRLKALIIAKEQSPSATVAELTESAQQIYSFLSPIVNYDTLDMESLACILDRSYETLRVANAFLWSLNLNTQDQMKKVLSSKRFLNPNQDQDRI